ncbi:hypothetical protein Tco_0947685, partial [Tanacetum coccineum]
DDPIACLNKAMAFLTPVASSRFPSITINLELPLIKETKPLFKMAESQCNKFRGDKGKVILTEDLDTYDSDCDDISNAKAVLMANISNYGSDAISKEKANKEQNNESVTAELKRYKERVKTFKQCLNIDLSSREKMIDSQMDDMIKEKLALKEQVDSLEQNISKQIKENECLLQTFTVFKSESKEEEDRYMENEIDLEKKIKELDNILFKVGQSAQNVHMKAQRIKPTLYYGIVISDKHVAMPVIADEETLILEEKSRSKMSKKAKDPEVINNNISHKPIESSH